MKHILIYMLAVLLLAVEYPECAKFVCLIIFSIFGAVVLIAPFLKDDEACQPQDTLSTAQNVTNNKNKL